MPDRPRIDELPPIPKRMRVQQAGEILGVSADTVRRLVARGELGCNRIGGSIRIGPEHLETYLERTDCPARDQTEPGASGHDQTEPGSTLTGGSTGETSGYPLARRTRKALDKHSPTLRRNLSVIEGST